MRVEMGAGSIRNEDGRRGSSSLLDSIFYRRKDGLAEVLSASLLRVGASDDICAYIFASIELLEDIRVALGGGAYRTRWSAGRGNCQIVSACHPPLASPSHSRSLLSGETLEQHLCVAVDAEVLDGLAVRGRACRIRLPRRGFAERGAQGSAEGLHRDNVAVTEAELAVRDGI